MSDKSYFRGNLNDGFCRCKSDLVQNTDPNLKDIRIRNTYTTKKAFREKITFFYPDNSVFILFVPVTHMAKFSPNVKSLTRYNRADVWRKISLSLKRNRFYFNLRFCLMIVKRNKTLAAIKISQYLFLLKFAYPDQTWEK